MYGRQKMTWTFNMNNMTEVAQIAINFYLNNIDNDDIIEGKYLPSQTQSWAKMKKTSNWSWKKQEHWWRKGSYETKYEKIKVWAF